MAKDVLSKKRKASVPESGAETKKVKKVEATDVAVKKRKAIDDAGISEVKKPKKTSKSRVEEPATLDNHEKEINGDSKAAKTKKDENRSAKKANDESKTKGSEPQTNDEEVEEVNNEDDDDASVVDDQTEALLHDFESDGDEADDSNTQGLEPGQEIPELKLSKKEKKKLKKASEEAASNKPGVVYVGRIPHGFYEHEMRAYFKQFGDILKLRLSRNRNTGASKHYAFIQFESAAVAEIVAKSMDNYLLFGHILKVKFVPDEQVPPNVFKGANKRFKKVPWNKIEGRKLAQGASEEIWEKRIELEEKKRATKAEKLSKIGYEFDSPKIKSAKGVAKERIEAPEVTSSDGAELQAIEGSASDAKAIEAAPSAKDAKSDAQGEGIDDVSATTREEPNKPKTKKKRAIDEEQIVENVSGDAAEGKSGNSKKAKGKKAKAL